MDDGKRIVECPIVGEVKVLDERGREIDDPPETGEVVRVFGSITEIGETVKVEPHAVQRLGIDPELWKELREALG